MSNYIQLFNIKLNLNKKLMFSLKQIFGINSYLALIICKKFGFNSYSLTKNLNSSTLKQIRIFLLTKVLIQDQLKKQIQSQRNFYSLIKSVRGLRYKLKLPVRGQRTRTNRKTCRRVFL